MNEKKINLNETEKESVLFYTIGFIVGYNKGYAKGNRDGFQDGESVRKWPEIEVCSRVRELLKNMERMMPKELIKHLKKIKPFMGD